MNTPLGTVLASVVPPRWRLTEVQLGMIWIGIVSHDDRSTVAREKAIEVACEIMKRIKAQVLWDEKEALSELAKMQLKGPITYAMFKKFLCGITRDAQMVGLMSVEEKILSSFPVWWEELHDLWKPINTRYMEVTETHTPTRGPKCKKGTMVRVRRRKVRENVGGTKMQFDYYAEDGKGFVYCFQGQYLVEIEHSAVPAKVVQSFLKLDEERGEKVVDPEQDPMGLTLPYAVLGVDVATAVARSLDSVGMVPSFLRQCVDYIDQHLEEEGLYRIPGGSRRINEMCYMANQGRPLILEPGDVENCCSVVVRWLRTLPDRHGLLWNELTGQWRGEYVGAQGNDEERLRVLKKAVAALPPENNATLVFLLKHFKRVGEADNKMSLKNLDICIPGSFELPSLIGYAPQVWPNWDSVAVASHPPSPTLAAPAVVLEDPQSAPATTTTTTTTSPSDRASWVAPVRLERKGTSQGNVVQGSSSATSSPQAPPRSPRSVSASSISFVHPTPPPRNLEHSSSARISLHSPAASPLPLRQLSPPPARRNAPPKSGTSSGTSSGRTSSGRISPNISPRSPRRQTEDPSSWVPPVKAPSPSLPPIYEDSEVPPSFDAPPLPDLPPPLPDLPPEF